jgi:hypothetical protein
MVEVKVVFYYGTSAFELQALPNDFDSLARPVKIVEVNICDGERRTQSHGAIDFSNLYNLKCAIDNYLSTHSCME